eukprot:3936299-Rhodomonas_salina.3
MFRQHVKCLDASAHFLCCAHVACARGSADLDKAGFLSGDFLVVVASLHAVTPKRGGAAPLQMPLNTAVEHSR